MNQGQLAFQEADDDSPVKCQISGCGHTASVLVEHVMTEHKMTPEQYVAVTGGAPLHSAVGQADFDRQMQAVSGVRRVPVRKTDVRRKKEYSICETFNVDFGYKLDDSGHPVKDGSGRPIKKDPKVWGYEDRTEHVPEIDPGYVFPLEDLKMVLLGITERDNILIVGDTGVGKTSLIEQVAARLNFQVIKLSFDGGITRQDLVGEWVIKGREMVFQYGVLVIGFQMAGTIIILDEWDTISSDCSFVLQRPLQQNDRKIFIMETGGELIALHPDNCIMATANTAGQGDDTGLYSQGTKVQNYAQINRFSMTIRMKYLEPDIEKQMLAKRFPDLKQVEIDAFVRTINEIREAHSKGELSAPLSTRDLINWASKYLKMGDPLRAAKYCFINRMPPEDAQTAEQLVQRIFDHT